MILLAALAACALPWVPASSAGVRHVVVVNLLPAPASVALEQGPRHMAVATGAIESKRDRTFDIPEGTTTLAASSSACASAKHLALPTQANVRVVINTGCALSIQ
ncbi:MAG TPA: hypothetical protein VMS32_00160 [Verrucomicrobiae bacterium]|nr:hypothetical protein [Verrucomicrobiae bacterium]